MFKEMKIMTIDFFTLPRANNTPNNSDGFFRCRHRSSFPANGIYIHKYRVKKCRVKILQLGRAAILLASLSLSVSVHAAPGNIKEPIHLTADSAQLDNRTGISVYIGNVKVVQGAMQLTADKMTVHSSNKKISKLIAEGTENAQACYIEKQADDKETLKAWADTITYDVEKDVIDFKHYAKVIRLLETFTGDMIQYHRAQQLITARGGLEKDNRQVQIIIKPKDASSQPSRKK